MNRDRGNIKWNSLMLPEHVTELRQWYSKDNDVRKPKYDEFSLNAIADEINIAFQAQSNVLITYWTNNRTIDYKGQIYELLPNEQSIKIRTEDNHNKLKVKHIVKMSIYD